MRPLRVSPRALSTTATRIAVPEMAICQKGETPITGSSVMSLGPARQQFDLILADPPYETGAGGVALDVWSVREAPLVGAGLAVAGLLVLLWSTRIHRRRA